jgi:argininosuccinate synthase
MSKKKVVLAYSGGLDTSIILKWLIEQDYEVIAYLAHLGQKEDFEAARAKAIAVGASKVYVEDLRREFVTDFIYPAFSANAMYEGRYLMGTSIARPVTAKRQIEIANIEGADYVSHGATGKGNDQVRFELAYYALKPDVQVLAPWKMPEFLAQFKGRPDMLAYAEKHGIPVTATKAKPYSEDENLLHISHEAGVLEDPWAACDDSVYNRTTSPENAPDTADTISLHFERGIPVKAENHADKTVKTDPLDLFLYLNEVGAKHGIGRLDMVENRFVGIKSRGVYETPGGTILLNAHRDLEGITMDREVLKIRDGLSLKLSELIYNGFWFSPEFRFLMDIMRKSQETVNGEVKLKLFKGVAYPVARRSLNSLYNPKLSSMDEEGGFNQMDSAGFIRINAVRLKADYFARQKETENASSKRKAS